MVSTFWKRYSRLIIMAIILFGYLFFMQSIGRDIALIHPILEIILNILPFVLIIAFLYVAFVRVK
jgi:hypothetical protein